MIYKFKKIISDDFFRHTGIMIIGSTFVNIFNFVYHFVLVRLFTGVEYGIFNSLISLTMISSVAFSPIQATLTQFLSAFFAHKEFDKVVFILRKSLRKFVLISLFLFLSFIYFSPYLAAFLQIRNHSYLIVVGFLVAISMIQPIAVSFLQSVQLFNKLAGVSILSTLAKLIIGILLVYFGFGVMGGLVGFIACPSFVILISSFLILSFLKKQKININEVCAVDTGKIYQYFFSTAFTMLAFVVLTNADIVLVKHFFSPEQAGFYSIAQMVGKILLFLPGAISIVMFPKSVSLYSKSTASFHLLKKGLGLAFLFCGTATTVCLIMPEFVLRLLTSKLYPESLELVGWFAVAMSFYAFVWITMFFHLSIENTGMVIPFVFLALAQTITIYFYHPSLKFVLYILTTFAIITFFINIFALRKLKKMDMKTP